ncbi:FlgD immunoglobulin-like domain containing protein [Calditrichota bacterium]
MKGVSVKGNFAYITDEIKGLIVLDVSDLNNPTFISNVQIQYPYEFASDIEIFGNYCVVLIRPSSWPTPTPGGFRIYDLNDPANPSHLLFRGVPGSLGNFFFKNETLFVATGTAGFYVFDLSNPNSPMTIGHFDEILNINHISAHDNIVYATASSDGLRIIDISDLNNITQISAFKPGGPVGSLAYYNNYIFMMYNGMQIVDVSNLSIPQIVTYMSFVGSRFSPQIYNNILLAGSEIIDINDPLSPYKLSNVYESEFIVWDGVLNNDILYLILDKAFIPAKMNIYQFDPVSKLIDLKNFNDGEKIAQNSSKSVQWDAYNAKNINIKFSSDNGSTWDNLQTSISSGLGKFSITIPDVISNKCLLKIEDTNDTLVNDISDTTFIVYDPSIRIYYPNGGEEIEVESTYIIQWYLDSASNVYINLDYSTDDGISWQPIVQEYQGDLYYYIWQIPAVSSKQCLIKITDNSDITRFDFSDAPFTIYDPTNIQNNNAEITKDFQILNAYPNPFNSSTNISFNVPFISPVEINIFSTLGDKIYSKIIVPTNAGINNFVWDGKDNAGKEISSGLYLYSISYNKLIQFRKFLLVK